MPSGVVPHYRKSLLVWCHTISHAYWCIASLYVMLSGVVPHYQPCLLVCCLTIDHALWCGASSSTMPVDVVPHYRPCLLTWYFTIGHAFWSIATAINILLVECIWKKGGYKSGGCYLYRGAIISDMSDDLVPHSDMPACTMQLYQTCMLGS